MSFLFIYRNIKKGEKEMKKRLALIGVGVCMAFILNGCAVMMAAKQPAKKDVNLLVKGMPRKMLLVEFGNPISSEVRDGIRYDIFSFTQGYSTGVKAGRAVFHGAADVFTLGLWEVVGTPAESIFDGQEIAYEVSYDDNDKVDEVILLKKK